MAINQPLSLLRYSSGYTLLDHRNTKKKHSQIERDREKQAIIDRKKAEQAKKDELVDLFKPIHVQQKVPFGVNPKTILCAFHKAGTCTKGDKCKFSHDLNVERKATKRDLYTDNRDDEKENGRSIAITLGRRCRRPEKISEKEENPRSKLD